MSVEDINTVTVGGNLTRDPELRTLNSGMSVCSLRIASNSSRKDASGDWVPKANYLDVTVWGGQGESCARFLTKGKPVVVTGRLDWREWSDQQGNKRQAVDIVADRVRFYGNGDSQQQLDVPNVAQPAPAAVPSSAVPATAVAAPLGDDVDAAWQRSAELQPASTSQSLPAGRTPATPENIANLCICSEKATTPTRPNDACPIERHGLPFARPRVPDFETRRRDLFVGDVLPPGEGMA